MSKKKGKTHLEMAKELDELDRDLRTEEADLLDLALKTLKAGKRLGPKDAAKFELIYEKYMGDEDDEGRRGPPEVGEEGETEPEDFA